MTFELAKKRPPVAFIDTPGIIIILAIVWLLIEDLYQVSKPHLITAGQEIRLTVENNPGVGDIWQAKSLFPIMKAFAVFYIAFLFVEIWS